MDIFTVAFGRKAAPAALADGPNGLGEGKPRTARRGSRQMQFNDADAADGRALIEYLDNATRNSAQTKAATYAAQHLSPGMRVLDAGCGTGDDVRAIAEIVGPAGHVTGVDSSRTMIEEARVRGVPANAAFVAADAGALPLKMGLSTRYAPSGCSSISPLRRSQRTNSAAYWRPAEPRCCSTRIGSRSPSRAVRATSHDASSARS